MQPVDAFRNTNKLSHLLATGDLIINPGIPEKEEHYQYCIHPYNKCIAIRVLTKNKFIGKNAKAEEIKANIYFVNEFEKELQMLTLITGKHYTTKPDEGIIHINLKGFEHLVVQREPNIINALIIPSILFPLISNDDQDVIRMIENILNKKTFFNITTLGENIVISVKEGMSQLLAKNCVSILRLALISVLNKAPNCNFKYIDFPGYNYSGENLVPNSENYNAIQISKNMHQILLTQFQQVAKAVATRASVAQRRSVRYTTYSQESANHTDREEDKDKGKGKKVDDDNNAPLPISPAAAVSSISRDTGGNTEVHTATSPSGISSVEREPIGSAVSRESTHEFNDEDLLRLKQYIDDLINRVSLENKNETLEMLVKKLNSIQDIRILSSLFDQIYVEKDKINLHRRWFLDKISLLDNTKGWKNALDRIRSHALELLMDNVKEIPDKEMAKKLLLEYRYKKIFSAHRGNFLAKIGRTDAQITIDKEYSVLDDLIKRENRNISPNNIQIFRKN